MRAARLRRMKEWRATRTVGNPCFEDLFDTRDAIQRAFRSEAEKALHAAKPVRTGAAAAADQFSNLSDGGAPPPTTLAAVYGLAAGAEGGALAAGPGLLPGAGARMKRGGFRWRFDPFIVPWPAEEVHALNAAAAGVAHKGLLSKIWGAPGRLLDGLRSAEQVTVGGGERGGGTSSSVGA